MLSISGKHCHISKLACFARLSFWLEQNEDKIMYIHFIHTRMCICKKNQPKAHFFINDLIQLYCLQHVSNNKVFIWSTSGCIWYRTQPDIEQTAYINGWYNTIKLQVQFFLKMNTWLSETCRRQYNWIKSLMKKSVPFVGSSYIRISRCTVQTT